MLDIKPRPSLAAATAEGACAFTTARVAGASAVRGVAFWSQVLHSSAGRPLWPFLPGPGMFLLLGSVSATAGTTDRSPAHGPTEPAEPLSAPESAFASYRSAGGHAAAQVVVSR